MSALESMLGSQSFFYGMEADHLATLAHVASPVDFAPGEVIFREGGDADACYLILEGDVGLEMMVPGRGPHVIQTLHSGEILGWSWLFRPYRWVYDAQALTPTKAVRFDAPALRRAKGEDCAFGYELMTRFTEVLASRMQAARLQLLDLYGSHR